MKKNTVKIILIVVPTVLLLIFGVMLAWLLTPMGPMPEALDAIQGSPGVQVEQGPWLVFRPVEMNGTGFILYPGARVDYRSYAPDALEIARQGYLVIITPMPLNMAIFDPSAAEEVIKAFPEIKLWAIGGHSLGGVMAAQYLSEHPADLEGLVFWASYPASNNDLSQLPIKVASISGSVDGFSTPDKINASKPLLPADTVWVVITGGNHNQFGWYGFQNGDGIATISREDQTRQVAAATVTLLLSLDN